MSMVYFKANDGTLVTMDGETSIDVSKSNTVVSSSVLSNREVSSDLLEGNLVISVQGVVTYTKSASQEGNPTPEEWVDLMESTISSGSRFTLYSVKYRGDQPLLKDYPNLVIQDYGYVVDRFESSLTVRVIFKEVFVTDSATIKFLTPVISSSLAGSLQEPTTGSSGTSSELSEDDRTFLLAGIEETVAAVKGIFTTEDTEE